MKVSSAWLQKWLRRTMLSDHEMVQALETAGIEVEHISASTQIDQKVIVGLVKKVVQHPGANRLHLVQVETGEGELGIVCGAPNVREGQNVALAQIGSVLPGGERIEKAKLRGEVSEGMLCSARELGLGTDHNGIIELSSKIPAGTPLCDIYPADTEITIKTPANRFDLLSVVGLAREVAAMSGNELGPLAPPIMATSTTGPEVSNGAQAARYMLARVTVDPTTPSPRDMAAHLRTAGMRSLGPVVDVTNYVMLEYGQPLHAFDAAKVKLPISVRYAANGETLHTLDGVDRKLTHEDLVIADANGPIGLAGVMGGAATEVGSDTREVLLEGAIFDGAIVRKMAKRHGIRTEASARFERQLPVQLTPIALGRAVSLLSEIAGGELVSLTDQLNVWPWVQRLGLRVARLSKLLGFSVTHKEAIASLAKLQIEAQQFDIAREAKSFVGKPYKYGASYKTDQTEAFDCSYLVDYLYSLIGVQVGFTALGQFNLGREVSADALQPGDAVFVKGNNLKAATDHYFTRSADGAYEKHEVKPAQMVGHVGLYVGDGKVVHASPVEKKVVLTPLATFTEAPDYLGARRFVDNPSDYLTIPHVPWWRTDLKLEEDLVEEVVRVLGYERVPSTIPAWRPADLTFDRLRGKRRLIRDVLYASGLFEVMTYSFVSEDQLKSLNLEPGDHLKLKNPLSTEQAYLRSSLLASHLAVLAHNRNYGKSVGFYEMSQVFLKRGHREQPDEPARLAVMMMRPEQSFAYVKGILDATVAALNVPLEIKPDDVQVAAPGRAGTIKLNGHALGWIGQLHPSVLHSLKVEGEAAYFELDLAPLLEAAGPRQFAGLERFPTIQRDITVLVPYELTWSKVRQELAGYHVEFVGDYTGAAAPAGYKSLTLRFTVAHPERTPTEAEAADMEAALLRRLERKLGARQRD